MEFIVYNLRVAMLLTVFYMLYRLLLSKETFLRTNRIVLLLVIALSFVLPNCHLTFEQGSVGTVIEEIASSRMLDEIAVSSANDSLSWLTIHNTVIGVYILGAIFFLGRVLWAIMQILRLLSKGERKHLDGATLIINNSNMSPFSWIRFVSMNRTDYEEGRDEILTHEMAHIHYGHSIDLMALDIACCIQWFNPAMWLLRREMCAVHEYEADKAVLDSGVNAKQYQLLLIKKAAGSKWSSIANSFNHSKLKSRITMMLRKESSVWARAKVLYALPIIGGAMIAFANVACNESEDMANSANNVQEEAVFSQNEKLFSSVERDLIENDRYLSEKYAKGLLESVKVEDTDMGPVITQWVERENGLSVAHTKRQSFLVVDEMPEFPGGDLALRSFLTNEVKYPKEAAEMGIQGRVFVSFVVNAEGYVDNVRVARKSDKYLDAEAVRVVKAMPQWTPGKQRGENVPVSYTVPVNFKLQ